MTCAELLDALRNGFEDPTNRESADAILTRYPDLQVKANEAWERLVLALAPDPVTGNRPGLVRRLDDVLAPEEDFKAVTDALEDLHSVIAPVFSAISRFRREEALNFGMPPESNRVQPEALAAQVTHLAGIAKQRRVAWANFNRVLSDSATDLDTYRNAIAHQRDTLLAGDAVEPYLSLPEQLRSMKDPETTLAFSSAIRLFQVGPQEVLTSVAYLTLQLRNLEARTATLGSLLFQPRRHKYSGALVGQSRLYRITHQIERLFYGGSSDESNASASVGSIEDITFIPIQFFPGQVIGQIVLIPPFEVKLERLMDVVHEALADIRVAVAGEFGSLVLRLLGEGAEGKSETIDPDGFVRAATEALCALLSLSSIVAFRREDTGEGVVLRAHTAWTRPRKAVQPYEIVRACAGMPADGLPDGFAHKGELSDQSFFTRVLENHVLPSEHLEKQEISPVRGSSLAEHIRQIESCLRDRVQESTLVVPAYAEPAGSAPGDRHPEADLGRLLSESVAPLEGTRPDRQYGSYLILRLPIAGQSTPGSSDEAIFVAHLLEPPRLVEGMATGVLQTLQSGLETYDTLLPDVIQELFAKASEVRKLIHDTGHGSAFMGIAARLAGASENEDAWRHERFQTPPTRALAESLKFESIGRALRDNGIWHRASETREGITELIPLLMNPEAPDYPVEGLMRHLLGSSWANYWTSCLSQTASRRAPIDRLPDSLVLSAKGLRTRVDWFGPGVFIEELARNAENKGDLRYTLFAMDGPNALQMACENCRRYGHPAATGNRFWALVYADNSLTPIPDEYFRWPTTDRHHWGLRRVMTTREAFATALGAYGQLYPGILHCFDGQTCNTISGHLRENPWFRDSACRQSLIFFFPKLEQRNELGKASSDPLPGR